MSQSLLIAFVMFATVMFFTPGPNNIMLLSSGLTYGFRPTIPHIMGITIGFAFSAVGLGLGTIFIAYPVLQTILKYAGVAYLIYLAVMIWRHARDPLPEMVEVARSSNWQTFGRALLLQLSNPKIMVFFGSIFLSVLPHDMPAWMQVTVLAIIAIDEFAWYALLTLLFSGGAARAFYRRAKFWIERVMGGALALLGLRLAMSAR